MQETSNEDTATRYLLAFQVHSTVHSRYVAGV